MIARFKELKKTKKIIRVVKIGEGLSEVQFEGKVSLRLNHTEAKVLEKDLKEDTSNLNAHSLSEKNKGTK